MLRLCVPSVSPPAPASGTPSPEKDAARRERWSLTRIWSDGQTKKEKMTEEEEMDSDGERKARKKVTERKENWLSTTKAEMGAQRRNRARRKKQRDTKAEQSARW